MNKFLEQVQEFHKTFKAPVLETPQIPSIERSSLRVELLSEELKELQGAIDNNDLVEVFDGLCDLMYVLCGTIHEFGLQDKFGDAFDNVHNSNMSKACSSLEEAEQTIEFYAKKDGTEAYCVNDGDKWLVYRKSDNKVLKSINYKPADLNQFLK